MSKLTNDPLADMPGGRTMAYDPNAMPRAYPPIKVPSAEYLAMFGKDISIERAE